MAVNFNLLKQAGPANFYEGLVQGQEQQRVNALTQQKIAQDQEMNALRLQQVRGEIGQQERKVKAETAAQKTAMFRDRLLRASNPNSVRELVKMQYADPDVGALLSQTGSLEQALAEVPDDPVQFERYRQQEALGMTEWMKSQLPKTVGGSIYDPAKGTFLTPPAAPPAPTDIAKLIKERDALPLNSPNRALYDKEIANRSAVAENARKRLEFDQNKFNWEKANPGYEIREADDGSVVGVNKRTLQAFPVTLGGGAAPTAAPAAGGAGMPSARVPAPQAPLAGATPTAGKPLMGKGTAPTEGERKAATLLQRLQGSQNQLTQALLDDPTAAGPQAFATAVGKLSTTGANLLNTGERQRVEAAQLDILDAALTLGTGAAYTREQLEGYRQSYFPTYGDKPENIKDKQDRLKNVIDAANIAAGKAGKLVPKPPPVTGSNDVRSAADKILEGK